ncbi:MAG: hypothetical protein U1A78_37660 [Polyangia bacterium]
MVPIALRPTNILLNDPHYRKVGRLWRAWVQYGHQAQPSRAELCARRQRACQDLDRFALLLIVRALHDLGYEAEEPERRLQPGAQLTLRAPASHARLCLQEQGVVRIELRGPDGAQERPLSLTVASLLLSMPVEAKEATEPLRALCAASGPESLLLVVGSAAELARMPASLARALSGRQAPSGAAPSLRLLAISPWVLDNTERLARVLRWFEARARAAAYPPRVEVAQDAGLALPKWLHRSGQHVAAIAPPSEAEQSAFAEDCARRRIELREENAAAQRGRRAFDESRLRALDGLAALAQRACTLNGLCVCPVCNGTSSCFEPRPGLDSQWQSWSYFCKCPDCEASWGLRVCKHCQLAFPVLSPGSGAGNELQPWWDWSEKESAYGRDLFAEPCRQPSAFVCTHCGACPCGRCSGG